MANDVEAGYRPSTMNQPCARLCNFDTSSWTLRPAHRAWLQANVAPVLRRMPGATVQIRGLASKVGSAAFNDRLSADRARATREALEDVMLASLGNNVQMCSYGERLSQGRPNDNDGYYRAVIVSVYANSPPPLPAPPIPARADKVAPQSSGIWLGVGGKWGLHAVYRGWDQAVMNMHSYDNFHNEFFMSVTSKRSGPGGGYGAGVVIGLVTGVTDPVKDLHGFEFKDWDFQISVVTKLSSLAKSCAHLPAMIKIAQAIQANGKLAKGVKYLSKPQWEQILIGVKSMIGSGVGLFKRKEKQVILLDVPVLNTGTEASFYRYEAKVSIW